MAFRVRHVMGYLLIVTLTVIMILSVLQTDCACTGEGECFCIQSGKDLHDISEEDLLKIPEPERSEYQNFLHAWETEFALRTQEWTSLYVTFHAKERTEMQRLEFDRQLANAYRNFSILFRDRHQKFRERLGIGDSVY